MRGGRHLIHRGDKRGKAVTSGSTGPWYPRWFWPSLAAPAFVWQFGFFLLSLYVILATAFGSVDLFRNPVPTLQPWWWDATRFRATLGEIFDSGGLYLPVYVRTFAYVGVAALLSLVIGYAVAYYIAFHAERRRGLLLVLVVTPLWISYVMRMFSWQGLLTPDGLVNRLLAFIPGVEPVAWLAGQDATVVLGLVYGYIAYMVLPLYAQLSRIDPSLLQAAGDLGARPAQTFVRVTLPLSRPGILAGLIIITLPMMGDYFTNQMLSSVPSTAMIGNIVDDSIQLPGQGPLGASVAVTLMLILLVPMVFYLRATRSEGTWL